MSYLLGKTGGLSRYRFAESKQASANASFGLAFREARSKTATHCFKSAVNVIGSDLAATLREHATKEAAHRGRPLTASSSEVSGTQPSDGGANSRALRVRG